MGLNLELIRITIRILVVMWIPNLTLRNLYVIHRKIDANVKKTKIDAYVKKKKIDANVKKMKIDAYVKKRKIDANVKKTKIDANVKNKIIKAIVASMKTIVKKKLEGVVVN